MHNSYLSVFRAHLHQTSESILWQLCNDANDTALIKNNEVTQKWVAIPFWSNSIVFIDSSISSIIAELSQSWLNSNVYMGPYW